MAKRPTYSSARPTTGIASQRTKPSHAPKRMGLPSQIQSRQPQARVFVVDDEAAVRRGLGLYVNLQPGLVICGEAADSRTALKEIRTLKPDLVIVDLRLQVGSGLVLIQEAHSRWPRLKILVFSMQDAAAPAERALRAGAHGYVTKEEGAAMAIEAIRTLLRGENYLSPRIAEKLSG